MDGLITTWSTSGRPDSDLLFQTQDFRSPIVIFSKFYSLSSVPVHVVWANRRYSAWNTNHLNCGMRYTPQTYILKKGHKVRRYLFTHPNFYIALAISTNIPYSSQKRLYAYMYILKKTYLS